MLDETDTIRTIAHRIWVTEGQPEGRALDHWLEARRRAVLDVETPWYDARTRENEIHWMRRALWQPQPFRAN
jgi:hypothetical protein